MAVPDYTTYASKDTGQNLKGASGAPARFDYVGGKLTQIGEGRTGLGFTIPTYELTARSSGGVTSSSSGNVSRYYAQQLGRPEGGEVPAGFDENMSMQPGREQLFTPLPGNFSTNEGDYFVPKPTFNVMESNMSNAYNPNFTSATEGPMEVRYTTVPRQPAKMLDFSGVAKAAGGNNAATPYRLARLSMTNPERIGDINRAIALEPEPGSREFGMGFIPKLQEALPASKLPSQNTLYGVPRLVVQGGRTALTAGAGILDIATEIPKNPYRATAAVGAGVVAGFVTQPLSIGKKVVSGQFVEAAKETGALAIQFGVGQAFFALGKGTASQGANVVRSGFNPKAFAQRYGPLEFEGFSKQTLAKARAQAQLEAFKTGPTLTQFREAKAAEQGRLVAMRLTPKQGPIETRLLMSEQGMARYVRPEQFEGLFPPSRLGPVKGQAMLSEEGVFYYIDSRSLGDIPKNAFPPEQFKLTVRASKTGLELVEEKASPVFGPRSQPTNIIGRRPFDYNPKEGISSGSGGGGAGVAPFEGGGGGGRPVMVYKQLQAEATPLVYPSGQTPSVVVMAVPLQVLPRGKMAANNKSAVGTQFGNTMGQGVSSNTMTSQVSSNIQKSVLSSRQKQYQTQTQKQMESLRQQQGTGSLSIMAAGLGLGLKQSSSQTQAQTQKQPQKQLVVRLTPPPTPQKITFPRPPELPGLKQKQKVEEKKRKKKSVSSLIFAGVKKRFGGFVPNIDLGSRTVAGFRFGPKAARGQLSQVELKREYQRTGGAAVRTPAEIRSSRTQKRFNVKLGFRGR